MNISVFAKYHVRAQEFDPPLDWEGLFERSGPLVVELGFGSGEFLIQNAIQHPSTNFVGFETSLTCMVKLQKSLSRLGINNVRAVLLDGRFGLKELFRDKTVDAVYVNFPCPWPKEAHKNRRLYSKTFVDTLASVLKDQGSFHLTTDVQWYLKDTASLLIESKCFSVKMSEALNKNVVSTRYEKKWLSRGKVIYALTAVKIKSASIKRITWEDKEMPHVHLKNVCEDKVKALRDKVFHEDQESVFVVKNVYSNVDEFLLRVISSDNGFQQCYFVLIQKRGKSYIVKIDPSTIPYRTPTVKKSVFKIAEVIQG